MAQSEKDCVFYFMEIRDHALIYGLLARKIIEHFGKPQGEKLIEEITVLYGNTRGKRMARLALENDEEKDLEAFMLHGEWKGKEGENQSEMIYGSDSTSSLVSKCAWHDTWERYDLLEYGPYYCRYIDKAICEGFAGSFDLEVKETISKGEGRCNFIWNEAVNEESLRKKKAKAEDMWILPFEFHVEELLECAMKILQDNKIIEEVIEEYHTCVEGEKE